MRSHVVLHDFIYLSHLTTKTSAFIDPKYIPFYYHLNKYISPINFLEIGFSLGLLSGAFLRNNNSVKRFVGFQTYDIPISKRFATRNIRSVYDGEFEIVIGNIDDTKLIYSWDLIIIDKEFNYDDSRRLYDRLWDSLNEGGHIVFENIFEDRGITFNDFCKIHQKDPVIFKTRYGTAIIKKD